MERSMNLPTQRAAKKNQIRASSAQLSKRKLGPLDPNVGTRRKEQ